MLKRSRSARLARLRKAAERARAKEQGLEHVSFWAPVSVMAKIRAASPLHSRQTIQAVLVDALTAYANQTEKGTQDLATIAVEYWPKIRPLLPYLPRLTSEQSPPIRVHDRVYTYADVKSLIPILQSMIRIAQSHGHSNYVTYLDLLVGRR